MGHSLRTKDGFWIDVSTTRARHGYKVSLAIAGHWNGHERSMRSVPVPAPGDGYFPSEDEAYAAANVVANQVIARQGRVL